MLNKGTITKLLGIIVMLVGVAMGVFLVERAQVVRERAKEEDSKYTLCHKKAGNNWVQIEVSREGLEEHLNHGDILGECPPLN